MLKHEILDAIGKLTVEELSEFFVMIRNRYGIIPVIAQPTPFTNEMDCAVETGFYDIRLISIDPNKKIQTIKLVRDVFDVGLKDAKDMVDNTPSYITSMSDKKRALHIMNQFEDIGASIEIN